MSVFETSVSAEIELEAVAMLVSEPAGIASC